MGASDSVFDCQCCSEREEEELLESDPFLTRSCTEVVLAHIAHGQSQTAGYFKSERELLPVIRALRMRGYKLEGGKDGAVSAQIWEAGAVSGLLSLDDFVLWFRDEIVGSPSNIRILLLNSSRMCATVQRLFAKHGESLEFELCELRDAVAPLLEALDREPPSIREIAQAVKLARGDERIPSESVHCLSTVEARQTLIELLVEPLHKALWSATAPEHPHLFTLDPPASEPDAEPHIDTASNAATLPPVTKEASTSSHNMVPPASSQDLAPRNGEKDILSSTHPLDPMVSRQLNEMHRGE